VAGVDFEDTPTIEPYLTARCKALTKYNMTGDSSAAKPAYQRLKLPWYNFCCWVKPSPLEQIKQIAKEFELSYRHFEQSLIGNILNLKENAELAKLPKII
jgi:hypothetical protein